jgi:hypothetical protein
MRLSTVRPFPTVPAAPAGDDRVFDPGGLYLAMALAAVFTVAVTRRRCPCPDCQRPELGDD